MKKLLSLNIKIGQMLGIVAVLKDRDGKISLQELSDESFLQVDDLINILDACKAIGIISTEKDEIKLNRKLNKKTQHELIEFISRQIRKLEPFSEIIKEIKRKKEISTTELFNELVRKGFINYRDNLSGAENFKKDLLVIGLRLKILSYNHEQDLWKTSLKN